MTCAVIVAAQVTDDGAYWTATCERHHLTHYASTQASVDDWREEHEEGERR